MGIFTRFKDIVSANINSMLDKAEDPEKMIKLMIQEMEDTLVEIKASCAGAMASKTKVGRALSEVKVKAEDWEAKAKLAVSKGRDDLAKEALVEKRNFTNEVERLEADMAQLDGVVQQYHDDIEQLELKLANARKKRQTLIQRHVHAQKRYRAQTAIRKINNSDAFARFEAFQNRIERMEADANLVNAKAKTSLVDEFAGLEKDEAIDNELAALKKDLDTSKPSKSSE